MSIFFIVIIASIAHLRSVSSCVSVNTWNETAYPMQFTPAAGARGLVVAGYQLVPEQSTAAIATHHPDAKYFSVISRLAPEAVPV